MLVCVDGCKTTSILSSLWVQDAEWRYLKEGKRNNRIEENSGGCMPIILHFLQVIALIIYLNRAGNRLDYFLSLNDSIDWAMENTISSSPYCPIT